MPNNNLGRKIRKNNKKNMLKCLNSKAYSEEKLRHDLTDDHMAISS